MKDIFLISVRSDAAKAALAPFGEAGFSVRNFADVGAALADMAGRTQKGEAQPALIILDIAGAGLAPDQVRTASMQFLRASAFSFLTAISSMPQEEFHDCMEGLGMLMPLPEGATRTDGERLLGDLRSLLGSAT